MRLKWLPLRVCTGLRQRDSLKNEEEEEDMQSLRDRNENARLQHHPSLISVV